MAPQKRGNIVRQLIKGGSVAATVATIVGGWAALARSAPSAATVAAEDESVPVITAPEQPSPTPSATPAYPGSDLGLPPIPELQVPATRSAPAAMNSIATRQPQAQSAQNPTQANPLPVQATPTATRSTLAPTPVAKKIVVRTRSSR